MHSVLLQGVTSRPSGAEAGDKEVLAPEPVLSVPQDEVSSALECSNPAKVNADQASEEQSSGRDGNCKPQSTLTGPDHEVQASKPATSSDPQQKENQQDSTCHTSASVTVKKKTTRKRNKRVSGNKVETQSKSGSQPGSSVSQSSPHANTRASRRQSNSSGHPRVCPVKGVPLPTSGPVNVAELFVLPPMCEASVPVTLVHDHTGDKNAQYLFEPTHTALMKGKLFRSSGMRDTAQEGRASASPCDESYVYGCYLAPWSHVGLVGTPVCQAGDEYSDFGGRQGRSCTNGTGSQC